MKPRNILHTNGWFANYQCISLHTQWWFTYNVLNGLKRHICDSPNNFSGGLAIEYPWFLTNIYSPKNNSGYVLRTNGWFASYQYYGLCTFGVLTLTQGIAFQAGFILHIQIHNKVY